MGNICSICYLFQDVLSGADMKRSRNIGRNTPPPPLYAVIASIVILKTQPRADLVTHEKIRDKGGKQRRGNDK